MSDRLGPLMLDIEGLELSADDRQLLNNTLVGGVIFFARNFQSIEQLRSLVDSIRAIRPELILAVDQEGGRVQRFKSGYTRIPPMQSFLPLYEKNPEETLTFISDVGWLMAAEVLASGVDMSFAPVLDVDDSNCSVIADRSFSSSPQLVAIMADAFLKGMHEAGMAVTGKHFPGHGAVTADSHLELPVDSRSFAAIESADLIPFAVLMGQLDAVMPAHIIFSDVDENPVGFSSYWLRDILREKMNFDGVIFSDDLSMEGAASAGRYGSRAKKALSAGCDVVLVCNNRSGALEVLRQLESDNIKPSSQLHKMAAKRWWDWGELKANDRWLKTQKMLEKIGC